MKNHIYIHIPFCESKCPYCAFGSFSDKFELITRYFDALYKEISRANLGEISSVFIGGGTPSAVKADFYEPIFEILRPNLDKNTEITSEANPNSANKIWLKKMLNLGVNRLSFGAQSFDEKKLKFLGRVHGKRAIFRAVENALEIGFKNVNLDLIYGSKFDTKSFLKTELESLNDIAKMGLSHVSAYSLTLEQNTPFFGNKSYAKDRVQNAKFLIKSLQDLGFFQYEISNFGRLNMECKHNLSYWRGEIYSGFGAFAVGFDMKIEADFTSNLSTIKEAKRLYSPKNLESYIKDPFVKKIEFLSIDDLRLERIFLGLRSKIGVLKSLLNEEQISRANLLCDEHKLKFENDRFFNTDFLLSDEIALFLTQN